MAIKDPIEDLTDAGEEYHESSDEDFNPIIVPGDDSASSSEDDAPAKPTQSKRKRKAPSQVDLDSGDEVTIEVAKQGRKKKQKGAKTGDDGILLFSDDEGGEGGLIKTRAQRRNEHKERKPLARMEGATIDVDALWAQMSSAPLKPLYPAPAVQPPEIDISKSQDVVMRGVDTAAPPDAEAELITVKRIYTFAGQRTTEEKEIPRLSLEQYLSEGWKAIDAASGDAIEGEGKAEATENAEPKSKIRRPLRRPSRFDPNPLGQVRGLPPEYQLTWPRTATVVAPVVQENTGVEAPKAPRAEKTQKLNVVDKSRLDWTGFVDKEGIAEELNVHGKTKEAYLGRMDFLAGVEARREEERKKAKAMAAA